MRRIFRLLSVICALQALPFPSMAGPDVTVFAAASLRNALEDIAAAHEGEVVVSYGGSGQIARQVAQGAPADVVILANAAWMDWLEGNALDAVNNRLDLIGNNLVLIGPEGAESLAGITADSMLERLDGGRLAMGHRTGVPAGIYGRQWFENAGIWQDIEPHIAETENVRTALALVARGEAPLGVVYATDAAADRNVVILYRIPDDMHDRIVYPAAVVGNKDAPELSEFMRFIKSGPASDLFRIHGFIPLAEPR